MRNMGNRWQVVGHWLEFCLAVVFIACIGWAFTRGALKVHDKAVERIAKDVQEEEAIRFTESRDNEYKEWQLMQIDFVARK